MKYIIVLLLFIACKSEPPAPTLVDPDSVIHLQSNYDPSDSNIFKHDIPLRDTPNVRTAWIGTSSTFRLLDDWKENHPQRLKKYERPARWEESGDLNHDTNPVISFGISFDTVPKMTARQSIETQFSLDTLPGGRPEYWMMTYRNPNHTAWMVRLRNIDTLIELRNMNDSLMFRFVIRGKNSEYGEMTGKEKFGKGSVNEPGASIDYHLKEIARLQKLRKSDNAYPMPRPQDTTFLIGKPAQAFWDSGHREHTNEDDYPPFVDAIKKRFADSPYIIRIRPLPPRCTHNWKKIRNDYWQFRCKKCNAKYRQDKNEHDIVQ